MIRILTFAHILFLTLPAFTQEPVGLRLMSLNLHGYHPMHERERYSEGRDGKITKAEQQLHYFSLDELDRGHERQLNEITHDVSLITPDVILLQEVGAGLPQSRKDCDEFFDGSRRDAFGKNTALRIQTRLNGRGLQYRTALACRGNIGWQTFPDTFGKNRILVKNSDGFQIVRDFGANPYPQGILVEGTAVLVREPWNILDNRTWHIDSSPNLPPFFFQTVAVGRDQDSGWILIANLHAGWSLQHFEQAVAVRRTLAEFVAHHPKRSTLRGVIVAGDFNARIFRPSRKQGDIQTVPWEISVPGEFDFGPNADDVRFAKLARALGSLNPNIPKERIQQSVSEFRKFTRSTDYGIIELRESVEEARVQRLCHTEEFKRHRLEPRCEITDRIDQAHISNELSLTNAVLLRTHNSFESTQGTSDHPAVLIDLELARQGSH